MKLKEIYLRAAELVAKGEEDYSCWAVHYCWIRAGEPHFCGVDNPGSFYSRVMANKRLSLVSRDIYEAARVTFGPERTGTEMTKLRDFRILSLCMMAAACDDLIDKGE